MGNVSEVEEKDSDIENIRAGGIIDRKDLSQNAPDDGETNIFDCPFDCYGVILEYLEEPIDIFSFMSSCKMFHSYFRNQNAIEKVTFTLSFRSEIKEKIEFIHRLIITSYYAGEIKNEYFRYFPNLKFLRITRSEPVITTKIFKYLPYLEEFYVRGGQFHIDNDCVNLSPRIRKISIRNRTNSYVAYKRGDTKNNFFTKVLLHRKALTEIEMWNINFFPTDEEFLSHLDQLAKLKKIVFRSCSLGGCPLRFPSNIEELDLEKTAFHCKGLVESFHLPSKKLKRLSLAGLNSSREMLTSLTNNNQVFESLTYLDISEAGPEVPDLLLMINKLFPKLEHIRGVNTLFRDEDIKIMFEMKHLRSVRVSMNAVKEARHSNNKFLKANVYGIQKVKNIKFLVI